ncbi:MAG: c-type cytochrome [Acidobacteriota bacterium]
MKLLSLSIALSAAAWSQSPQVLQRGEQVFTQTCGSGYCHGARAAGAGAPRLAARGFTQTYINTTASQGVPGTSMPAFAKSLPGADFAAVVAYVANLNGVASPAAAGTTTSKPAKLSIAGERGRALFSDATKSFGRCSTCHEVDGRGIPVAAPIHDVPLGVAGLKALKTPRVVTATVAGEALPALVVARKAAGVSFYDLTSSPPVLRSVLAAEFESRDGTGWQHSNVIRAYSDADLGTILGFLRATPKK